MTGNTPAVIDRRTPFHAAVALTELLGRSEAAKQLAKRGEPDAARLAERAAVYADRDALAIAEEEPWSDDVTETAAAFILSEEWLRGEPWPLVPGGILDWGRP